MALPVLEDFRAAQNSICISPQKCLYCRKLRRPLWIECFAAAADESLSVSLTRNTGGTHMSRPQIQVVGIVRWSTIASLSIIVLLLAAPKIRAADATAPK